MTKSDDLRFELMFKEHYAYLFNLANKILNEQPAAEDVVQNVFLKMWDKRGNTQLITTIKSYLSRAVINASYDYLKKSTRSVPLVPNHDTISSSSTEEYMAYSELEGRLNDAIDHLPEKCKVIFTLSRFQGLTSMQISEALGLSKKTVDNQLGIALKKLRTELKPYITIKSLSLLIVILLIVLAMSL